MGARVRSGLLSGVVCVGLAVLGVGFWLGDGILGSEVDLGSGSVWFGSPSGVVAQVEGSSGRRVAWAPVEGADGVDGVVQAGAGAVVVDVVGSQLVGVDGVSRRAGPPAGVGDGGVAAVVGAGGSQVWVLSGDGATVRPWGVRSAGVVEPLGEVEFVVPGGVVDGDGVVREGSLAVSPDGVLWVVGAGGELVSFGSSGRLSESVPAEGVEDPQVVLAVEGRSVTPVVVDPGQRSVVPLDGSGSAPAAGVGCVEGVEGEVMRFASVVRGPFVVGVSVGSGFLSVMDLRGDGGCGGVRVGQPSTDGGARWGRPVVAGGFVFVPDNEAGVVSVLEFDDDGGVALRGEIDLELTDAAAGRVVVFAASGFVWFDDPDGEDAGVLDPDRLAALKIDKSGAGDGEPTVTGGDGDADEVEGLRCQVAPNPVVPGRPVTVRGVADEGEEQPQGWRWAAPGGDPESAAGPSFDVSFAGDGTYQITGTAVLPGGDTEVPCPPLEVTTDIPADRPTGPALGSPALGEPTDPNDPNNPGTPGGPADPDDPGTPGGPADASDATGAGGSGGSAVQAAMQVTPDPATVGQPVTLRDVTSGATGSQWRIGGQDIPGGQNATWTPGPSHMPEVTITLTTTTPTGSGTATRTLRVNPAGTPAPGDTTAPVLSLPQDIVTRANQLGGRVVPYEATAMDAVDGPLPVTCTPASGAVFPVGTTTVTCTATDRTGNTAADTFAVGVANGALRVAAGERHSCALMADGGARCWGQNSRGELGNGTTSSSARAVVVRDSETGSALAGVVGITAGSGHSCAIIGGGRVSCWGDNGFGQLGAGSNPRSTMAVEIAGLTGVTALSAGRWHTCAVLVDGTARCWGRNNRGQLGNGSLANASAPVEVSGLVGAASDREGSIAAGLEHSCVVLEIGEMRCWGGNGSLQLGAYGGGPGPQSQTPLVVVGTDCSIDNCPRLVNVRSVAAGSRHTCAALADQTLACWGSQAALGSGGAGLYGVPVRVVSSPGGPPLGGVVAVAAATSDGSYEDHSCAVLASGEARCWGTNDMGQLGTGASGGTSSVAVPVSIPPFVVSITAGAAFSGIGHSCASLSDGTVRCWGAGGALGIDSPANSNVPVEVIGL